MISVKRLLHVVLTSADDSGLAIPAFDCAHRQVCCSQSRAASGVKVEGGAFQIEAVGHSICKSMGPGPDIAVVDVVLARAETLDSTRAT